MSDVIWAIAWAPLYTTVGILVHRIAGRHWWVVTLPATAAQGFMAAGFGTELGFGIAGKWLAAAIGAGQMGIGFLIWWHRRRKRHRAASLLGAKSRALRDALVRTMRRERRPSRVLRPHPAPS